MILCAGPQSGGTTLVSWCFLQRHDTNGVLDMAHDRLHTAFDKVHEPVLWVKMTVGAFRWIDVCRTLEDFGWEPEPLLIVRDVRAVYASLCTKRYGFNGTTAEEPPLRMRLRRFLSDWELFRANQWPILRFEDLLTRQELPLMQACADLSLSWDDAMVLWPKPLTAIAYVHVPNRTFAGTMGKGSLAAAILPHQVEVRGDSIPRSELQWLEKTFEDYNRAHGYALEIPSVADDEPANQTPLPRFEGSKRQRIAAAIERIQWISDVMNPQ
jgi:hypothetical protein